jgi:hypothetical protein
MEKVMAATVERDAGSALVDHFIDFIVDRVVEELAGRLQAEPEHCSVTPCWPADLRFEDDPEAIADPRRQSGLPRDLTGFVFGQLAVLGRSDVPGYWRVHCSCGIDKEVSREALRTGSARSCGCARLGLGPLRGNTVDLMGQRFGKLTVVGRARSRHETTAWRCRCQCGRFAEYRSDMLRAGRRVSCGCAEKAARFAPGRSEAGKATRFQPGSNRHFELTDELIRDDLLTEFRARGVTTDGRWFHFANGSCVRQGAIRARIAKRLGVERAAMDRDTKLRAGRIFKAVAAGLQAAPATAA